MLRHPDDDEDHYRNESRDAKPVDPEDDLVSAVLVLLALEPGVPAGEETGQHF